MPGIVDLRVQQASNQPKLHLDVDRTRPRRRGFTQRDVANNLLISLTGSSQTTPTFWLNPANGVSYTVATQTPQYRHRLAAGAQQHPDRRRRGDAAADARRRSRRSRATSASAVVVALQRAAGDRHLRRRCRGATSAASRATSTPILDDSAEGPAARLADHRPRPDRDHDARRSGLLAASALAIVLVYLLMVVNFQSWLDPFIIITALPAALAGIVWMLFLTHTTLSVPALTGAIMCMGVATANSILVVTFAKDELARGRRRARRRRSTRASRASGRC